MIIFEGLAFSIACGVGVGCGFGLIVNISNYSQFKKIGNDSEKLNLEMLKQEQTDMLNNLIEIDNIRLSRFFQILISKLSTFIYVGDTIEVVLWTGIHLVGLLLSLILIAVLQMP